MKTTYFSQLSAKQKDKTNLFVCKILAESNPKFIPPSLWKILFDVSFDEIMETKNEADKYCEGKCVKSGNVWIPIKAVELLKN